MDKSRFTRGLGVPPLSQTYSKLTRGTLPGTWRNSISLPPSCQQITFRFKPAGGATFSIRADLKQFSLLHEQPDHGQDRRRLRIHETADLGKAQSVLFVFQKTDQLCEHRFSQTPTTTHPDKRGRQRSMPPPFDTRQT